MAHLYTLHIRTWFDRVNRNTYSSGWLVPVPHRPGQIFPMQYGQPAQLARDVARSRGLPLELIDVQHAVEVRKSELYRHAWRVEQHARQSAPKGTRWAGAWRKVSGESHDEYVVCRADGQYLDSAPTLALARKLAIQRMSDGLRECHIERIAYSAVRRVSVPIETYLSETA